MGDNNENATRGVAYQESVKRAVRESIKEKDKKDQELKDLEAAIYAHETTYLESTPGGNILKGFDNYIKHSGAASLATGAPSSASATAGSTATGLRGRRTAISDTDRLFSRSSVGFMNGMRENSPSNPLTVGGGGGGSATSTPSQAATTGANTPTTPKAGAGGGGALKKGNKKGEQLRTDDEEGEKPPKRIKISFGRGEKD